MAIDDLRNLAQSGPPFWRARGAIGNAVGKLEVAVKLLEWGKPYGGLTLISYALDDLAVAESRDLTLDLSLYKEALAEMAKSEAYVAIAQAGDGPGMAEAEQLANEGDALLAAGNYRKAVDTYRLVIAKCWRL
jgi:tetratricopeptide (TPR) repeat protein